MIKQFLKRFRQKRLLRQLKTNKKVIFDKQKTHRLYLFEDLFKNEIYFVFARRQLIKVPVRVNR